MFALCALDSGLMSQGLRKMHLLAGRIDDLIVSA